jgi:hypothetical protein
MNRQELKQFIRHVFHQSGDSVTRGYVTLDPSDGEINYLSMGAKRSPGYALKHLLPVLWNGLTLVGAFAISESKAGGMLNYRTECRVIPLANDSAMVLEMIELALRDYVTNQVEDRVVSVAARSWDKPLTEAVQ